MKSILIITTLLVFFINPIQSQTADEIIAKHIEAHGGQENWNKVDALRVTGTFTAFSLEKEFECYKTRDGKYYADLYLGEIPVVESFNGETGWVIDPWQEMDYARNLNAVERNVLMQKTEFFTPFYNYKEKGHTVELTGKETMDGMDMYVLRITRQNGHVETWYLNAETYLEHLCESDWVDFAYPTTAETYFDDFRNVDGLILPFYIDRTFWQRSRILQVDNIEINPEIDDDWFVMPRREEMNKFEAFEGVWDVNVEIMVRGGRWYPMGQTTSEFEFVSTNMLQERITYNRIYQITRISDFVYNESGENYRISMFDDLSSSMSFYEGNFNDTAFVFENTHISFGKENDDENPRMRYIIYDVNDEGFIMERSVTTDKGETWGPRDRFTYTRK